jgi:saccharopine dehydrogenase (NAD+, L-glutamate forming)
VDDKTLRTSVYGERDPGYGATGRMLGQAALCLLQDVSKEDKPGGFWTPATIMAAQLIPRLEQHAGLRFSVEEPG